MRGGKRDTMARRMQAIDRAVADAWQQDYEAYMNPKKDVSARIKLTAEELAKSTSGGAWAKALEEATGKIMEAEATRWKDITRASEPFWRKQIPLTKPKGMTAERFRQMTEAVNAQDRIRGASFERVMFDEIARPPERIVYERQYQYPQEAIVRAVDDMGARLRYLQERVDRMEAELDLLRIRAEKKRPEPPARKTRAYGIR